MASALHSMSKTAAVELTNVAWDATSEDAHALPRAVGALQEGQAPSDVMGRRAEGRTWLSPVLCEDMSSAQKDGITGTLSPRNSLLHPAEPFAIEDHPLPWKSF